MNKELNKNAKQDSQVNKDVANGKIVKGVLYETRDFKLVPVKLLELEYKGKTVNDWIVGHAELKAERNILLIERQEILDKHDVESLRDIRYIDPTKKYITVSLNGNYICKGNDYIVELTVSETELYKGYCIIDNHKIYIDHIRKIGYINTLGGAI